MKLVALMYLEEDDPTVSKLLDAHGVTAYSRVPLEGLQRVRLELGRCRRGGKQR